MYHMHTFGSTLLLKISFEIGDHLIRLKPNCITIIAETHLITYKHISWA